MAVDLETIFKQWLGEHQGLLYRVVRAYGNTAADQDDLFQEICLQLWLSIPRFEGKAKVSTWIYRVALNTAAGIAAKKTRRKHRDRFITVAPQQQAGDSQPSQEIIERLYEAIRKLSKVDTSIVLMHLDGLGYDEMAQILGISESNVGVKLNRAKKQLPSYWEDLSMTFNELQKNYWQKDAAAAQLIIDSDMLIREVKRNEEAFESSVSWRDFREVAVSIIMVGVFLYGAFKFKDNIWVAGSLVVVAIMCVYVAAFFIVDRRLQRKKEARHTDPLLACIESSLIQVNHQIWLLKNVFWWYLLPPGAGMFLFFFVVTWNLLKVLPVGDVLPIFGVALLFVALVFWGVYWLNQYAVRKGLIPRKEELEVMLKNIANGDSTMP